MPRFRVVPWRSRDDLLRVRAQLYSLEGFEGLDAQRIGIDTVRAWKIRGNLPHLVESTALLIDAVRNDDEERVSPWSIRSTYSTSFARFVTGLLDSEQKLRTKRSMNSIAQELGMPLAYVDLRHQVTHEDMPSLAILRHATQRSLTWLWDYYWRRLDQPLRKAEEGAEEVAFRESVAKLREHFRDILRRFVRQEIEATKDQATATSVAGTTRSKRKKSANPSTDDPALQTCQKLIGVCRGKEGMLQELVAVLVEEKIMIPAARKLDDPMDRIFSLWDTLLQHLTRHQSSFLNLLARELILQTNSSSLDVPYCEAAQLWLLHIFTNKSWRTAPLSSLGSQSTLSHSSQRYLLDRRLDLNGVIASCMAPRPSLYNRKVIQSLMEDEVYGAQIKNDWGDIVDVAEKWMF